MQNGKAHVLVPLRARFYRYGWITSDKTAHATIILITKYQKRSGTI
jgi:hypothetical protein